VFTTQDRREQSFIRKRLVKVVIDTGDFRHTFHFGKRLLVNDWLMNTLHKTLCVFRITKLSDVCWILQNAQHPLRRPSISFLRSQAFFIQSIGYLVARPAREIVTEHSANYHSFILVDFETPTFTIITIGRGTTPPFTARDFRTHTFGRALARHFAFELRKCKKDVAHQFSFWTFRTKDALVNRVELDTQLDQCLVCI